MNVYAVTGGILYMHVALNVPFDEQSDGQSEETTF